MTHDEIEQRAHILSGMTVFDDHTREYHEQDIAQAIREAVVQAYEEAAQMAYHGHIDFAGKVTACNCIENATAAIRSLKDSLTVEETSQERRTENDSRQKLK